MAGVGQEEVGEAGEAAAARAAAALIGAEAAKSAADFGHVEMTGDEVDRLLLLGGTEREGEPPEPLESLELGEGAE